MRACATTAIAEAQAQLLRLELLRTRDEQLRARLRARYPHDFAISLNNTSVKAAYNASRPRASGDAMGGGLQTSGVRWGVSR